MDIWAWLGNLDVDREDADAMRTMRMVYRLSGLAAGMEHDRFDAIFPEALARARAHDHPWLEIFVRHWNLQSRLFKRADVRGCLAEAVALVALGSEPQNRDCPQRICASQDLAQAYDQMDGPGFAAERIAAVTEILGEINPTWPCWRCIGCEKISAIRDDGRPQDAIDEADRLEAAGVEAGLDAQTLRNRKIRFEGSKFLSYLDLGQPEEALDHLVDPGPDDYDDDHFRLQRTIERALGLARAGRLDEARDVLPTPEAAWTLVTSVVEWSRAAVLIGDLSFELQPVLRGFRGALRERHAFRSAFRVGALAADLALQDASCWTAAREIEALVEIEDHLALPCGADETVAALRARLDAIPPLEPALPAEAPESQEAFIELLPETHEAQVVFAEALLSAFPDSETAVTLGVAFLGANGYEERALQLLDRPELDTPVGRLARVTSLLQGGQQEDAVAAATALLGRDDIDQVQLHWYLALAAHQRADVDGFRQWSDRVLEADRAAGNAAHLRGQVEAKEGNLDAALGFLTKACETKDEVGPWDWDRMTVATQMGDWAAVRHSGARIGMTFAAAEGPVDEVWHDCLIRIVDDEGDEFDLWATRTGPVTARVDMPSPPAWPNHLHDLVIFEAVPLEHDRSEEVPCYRMVQVLTPAPPTEIQQILLPDPGEAVIEELRSGVMALGGTFWRSTAPGWERDLGEGPVPAIAALLAVPVDADPDALEAVLDLLSPEDGPPG
jgi:hypothetical protein